MTSMSIYLIFTTELRFFFLSLTLKRNILKTKALKGTFAFVPSRRRRRQIKNVLGVIFLDTTP